MTEQETSSVRGELEALRRSYMAKLPAQFAELTYLAGRLTGTPADRSPLLEIRQHLHRLSGSGGSFGLQTLSDTARDLEKRVSSWLSGKSLHMDPESLRDLQRQIHALSERVNTNAVEPQSLPPIHMARTGKTDRAWLITGDTVLAEELSKQLQSFNYVVHHFDSLSQAEDAARSETPDLLLVDVFLPKENQNATIALPTCQALRALSCPLIFISSLDDFFLRVQAARLGAAGYHLKPVNIPRLIHDIERVLKKRRAPPERVLIVEDDQDLGERYRLVLTGAGMEAEVLASPGDIINRLNSFRPELVLMDLYMPDYTGKDLAGVIRQHDNWTTLPIVFLSAETDIERQVSAMSSGADDFLTKPVPDVQLVAAVRARIDRARELAEHVNKDSLTGLLKHASIKEAVEIEIARARRTGKPLTLAMLDIDHFKMINDTHGHATGDVVIMALATLLRQRLRESDLIGRYGGEEFLVVLPECTAEDAQLLIDDIRRRFASLSFSHGEQPFQCTLSAGLASSTDSTDHRSNELLVAADEALYAAKRAGRNRVRQGYPVMTP
ncbi:diguanylate cyclase [Thioalkalivibrio sulfidiphilus]|uniref:diguanylate cyclase n=1 Tax=Thioalkalivibrio sulfidiphilus TaxID=1033854 RepID=UPI00037E65CC|nr:diguanylate cyclase [Thioalkalivibrio sulfidiphilus]